MDNKELVLALYRAFSEKDLVTLAKICSPNILWTQNPGFPGGGINKGVSNIIQNVYEANSARWDYFDFTRTSISAQEDKVLVEGHYIVDMNNSGKKVKAQTAHVFTIKDQKVVAFQQYTDTKTLWDKHATRR